MQTTGELIRLLGYVDDIAATLHRIDATIPTLTPEERKRLAEYMRKSDRTSSSYSRHWKREAISGRSVPSSATDAERLALLWGREKLSKESCGFQIRKRKLKAAATIQDRHDPSTACARRLGSRNNSGVDLYRVKAHLFNPCNNLNHR
jgi:hypothetical protein